MYLFSTECGLDISSLWCVCVSVCRFLQPGWTTQNYAQPSDWHQWRGAQTYWKHRFFCACGRLHDTRRYFMIFSGFKQPLVVLSFFNAVFPCFRFESYPKGPCKYGGSAGVWLGSWRIHGLWLSAQRGDTHSPQWTGCGERHVQVILTQKTFTAWCFVYFSLCFGQLLCKSDFRETPPHYENCPLTTAVRSTGK